MANPQQHTLKHSVIQAEKGLHEVERKYGKDSKEYRAAQLQLVRFWSILKMTRSQEEFLNG